MHKIQKKIIILNLVLILILTGVFILIFNNKNKITTKNEKIDLDLPFFKTEILSNNNLILSSSDFKNKIVLINFFASWCIPCKEEHKILLSLKREFPELIIIGINHKDKKDDAIKFLDNYGDPYDYVGIDEKGEIAYKFGVLGLPETFLTNDKNKLIFRHAGALNNEIIDSQISPFL